MDEKPASFKSKLTCPRMFIPNTPDDQSTRVFVCSMPNLCYGKQNIPFAREIKTCHRLWTEDNTAVTQDKQTSLLVNTQANNHRVHFKTTYSTEQYY